MRSRPSRFARRVALLNRLVTSFQEGLIVGSNQIKRNYHVARSCNVRGRQKRKNGNSYVNASISTSQTASQPSSVRFVDLFSLFPYKLLSTCGVGISDERSCVHPREAHFLALVHTLSSAYMRADILSSLSITCGACSPQ